MIQVNELTKYYGNKPAVQNISFSLNKGEIVGLLGANGSGKTTTIRMLSGFLIPSSGMVLINGQDLFSNPIEGKKSIGYLPEMPPLYEDLTVQGYLIFVSRIKGIPTENILPEVNRVCQKTSLTEKQSTLIAHLSLGFRKRVGIAQALLGNPPIVIMDEPISGLDPWQIVEIRNLIKELAGNHTVLLSSHILSEVQKTCDRFLFIKEGRVILDLNKETLEREIDKLASTLLGLSGKLENSKMLLNKFTNQISYTLHSEDINGYVFLVEGLKNPATKEKLLQEISQTKDIELLSINKQELKLEDIFDKLKI
jgi:ABC-2 type transport system ATP-binding protein